MSEFFQFFFTSECSMRFLLILCFISKQVFATEVTTEAPTTTETTTTTTELPTSLSGGLTLGTSLALTATLLVAALN